MSSKSTKTMAVDYLSASKCMHTPKMIVDSDLVVGQGAGALKVDAQRLGVLLALADALGSTDFVTYTAAEPSTQTAEAFSYTGDLDFTGLTNANAQLKAAIDNFAREKAKDAVESSAP